MKKKTIANLAEFILYIYLFYSMTSILFDIYIKYLSVFLALVVAALSLSSIGLKKILSPYLFLTVGTVGVYVLIQWLVFDISVTGYYVFPFITWLLFSIMIYPLSLRKNFIRRLAIVMLLIILILQPFALFSGSSGSYQRMSFEEINTGIDNSDDLAAWLGFSSLVFWLWAWRVSGWKRLLLWGSMLLAIILMLNTGSRAAPLALTIGGLVGMRSLPRRNQILSFLFLGVVIIGFLFLPQFENIRDIYLARLGEDTGRFVLWREAWKDISNHLLFGGGADTVYYRVGYQHFTSPHNAFLLILNASGVLPLILFVMLWVLSFYHAFRTKGEKGVEWQALLVYAFLEVFQSNLYFVSVWGVAALSAPFKNEDSGLLGLKKNKNN